MRIKGSLSGGRAILRILMSASHIPNAFSECAGNGFPGIEKLDATAATAFCQCPSISFFCEGGGGGNGGALPSPTQRWGAGEDAPAPAARACDSPACLCRLPGPTPASETLACRGIFSEVPGHGAPLLGGGGGGEERRVRRRHSWRGDHRPDSGQTVSHRI